MKMIVWIAGATLSGAIVFGAGLLVGRQFPAHHYEELGATSKLFDSTTGHVCEANPDTAPSSGTYSAAQLGLAIIPPCNSE